MKKIFLFILILSQSLFSQTKKESVLIQKSSIEFCNCISEIGANSKEPKMEYEYCQFEIILKYKKEFKSIYGQDFFTKQKLVNKFLIALNEKSKINCPKINEKIDKIVTDLYIKRNKTNDSIKAISENKEENLEYVAQEEVIASDTNFKENTIKGIYLGTIQKGFLLVKLKDENGKLQNFVYLEPTINQDVILNKELKLNTEIEIEYYQKQMLNILTNKFEEYKIIIDISKEENKK